jgi:hypothetical protein
MLSLLGFLSKLRKAAEAHGKDRGGRGEIRTHDTLAGMPVFKTGALNRSATLPSPYLLRFFVIRQFR